jgi:hypothetical protein
MEMHNIRPGREAPVSEQKGERQTGRGYLQLHGKTVRGDALVTNGGEAMPEPEIGDTTVDAVTPSAHAQRRDEVFHAA